jgi:HK97 gp10 family phage protein
MAGKIGLNVRNARAVISNLRQYGEAARTRAKVVVEQSMERVYATQQSLVAVDTGFMKSQTRKELTPQGYGYRVGWDAADFPAAFYPPFVEFGTRFAPAQPSLLPAFEVEKPRFTQELQAALSPRRGR